MTRRDIIVTVLSEVSGKPRDHFERLLKEAERARPGEFSKYDEQLPHKEAQELLAKLRAGGPGIMAWLVRGAMEVMSGTPPGQGRP